MFRNGLSNSSAVRYIRKRTMKFSRYSLCLLLLMALLLVCTAVQAKVGLYQPERSPAHITSQVFKVKEVRLERVAPQLPVEVVVLPVSFVVHSEPCPPEPDFVPPTTPDFTQSHWFRPPPALI